MRFKQCVCPEDRLLNESHARSDVSLRSVSGAGYALWPASCNSNTGIQRNSAKTPSESFAIGAASNIMSCRLSRSAALGPLSFGLRSGDLGCCGAECACYAPHRWHPADFSCLHSHPRLGRRSTRAIRATVKRGGIFRTRTSRHGARKRLFGRHRFGFARQSCLHA